MVLRARDRQQATIDEMDLYGRAARQSLTHRNPVVVIPGIMGSRLVAGRGARSIWGDFTEAHADPGEAEGIRLVALPMALGRPLDLLAGEGTTDGSLAELRCKFAGIPLKRRVYADVLEAMGVAGYQEIAMVERPEALPEEAADASAFEFDYDWRRSIDENAIRLQRWLKQLARFLRRNRPHREPLRFDVVAHSMGGLLLRYFLQYGGQLLPYDGSLPRPSWEGAAVIETAVLMGTPNGGSAQAIERLVGGMGFGGILPTYDPTVLGTMPSLYQLLPRARHGVVRHGETGAPLDPFDLETWVAMGWGLADPAAATMLERLLPGVDSPGERRRVALDHLQKCLAGAAALHRALDGEPPGRPPHLGLHLFVGDTLPTAAEVALSPGRREVRITRRTPGDGVVTRASALLDERLGRPWTPRLLTPLRFDSVTFVRGNHLGITRDRTAIDNVLFLLLERPRGDEA